MDSLKAFPRFKISIDRGGTFTDVFAEVTQSDGTRVEETLKLLSRDPLHYEDAPSEGIRRIMRRYVPDVVAASGPIQTLHLDEVRMGTTVATNALLERNGEPCAMVLTEGFADILDIGNQARPSIFALNIVKHKPLPQLIVEAHERVRIITKNELAECAHNGDAQGEPELPATWVRQGESYVVDVVQALNEEDITQKLQGVLNAGVRSVGIALMHSYAYTQHEQRIKAIALSLGFRHVSMSSELSSLVKYVPRSLTASVDAYLSPLIVDYISGFRSFFANNLADTRLYFIQSDGGLTNADAFYGYRAVLSGPAGGVMGSSQCTATDLGNDVQVVSFDMGGTSTDVSRSEGTRVQHVVEAEVAGTQLQAPQVNVQTVAAGGGSLLKWENGMFHVGPESAGAFPGPVCYGNNGPLTVTDANVVLGHLHVGYFPKVFGPNADQPLNKAAAESAFSKLAEAVSEETGKQWTVAEVAYAFIVVANETMCRPIRNLTEANGFRCADHVLSVFGGAGGQHACAMARMLGMSRIYLHRLASILSAVGTSMTDVIEERMSTCSLYPDTSTCAETIWNEFGKLEASATDVLSSLGFNSERIEIERYLSIQFDGTLTSLLVMSADTEGNTNSNETSLDGFLTAFTEQYKQQFGFLLRDRRLLINGVRIRAKGKVPTAQTQNSADGGTDISGQDYTVSNKTAPEPRGTIESYFGEGWQTINVYVMDRENGPIQGPALIVGEGTSVLVEEGSVAYTNKTGNLIIHTSRTASSVTTELDALSLSVFSHRFMSIAEQMGYALQRTSISTNIKERLDFSCAIFDPDGNLVANAPHIPVHLGAMGAAVRWQRDFYGDNWSDGDVVLTNHPSCGGSHLPDITVITPCFVDGSIAFYVASRGHHADVGGTTPGSMPPFSKSLMEEGAAIKTIKLVDKGTFNEVGVREALSEPGKYPGMSGCRIMEDCISDLRAQVAANNRGIQLVRGLATEYGLDVVTAYMRHIQKAAEGAARTALKKIAEKYGAVLSAVDLMDDGSEIRLQVTIDSATGASTFDFTGTSCQVISSTNCPTAIVHSAVIYCIRCLVDSEIPLNQGCMEPITVIVEPSSILAPDDDLPVVAGNVLTSQRVTDVIFSALRAAACSQGCMNNFTMGTATSAYYETVCGGSGAGDGFHGASAVHTHMTNTRLTDPEVLEARYPVLLRRFSIRRGSGGAGKYHGGDGVVRSFLFLQPSTVVVLTERRVLHPKGLLGGGDGSRGLNLLFVPSEKLANTWKSSQDMIHSPDRGVWGDEVDENDATNDHNNSNSHTTSPHEKRSSTRTIYRPRNIGGKNAVQVKCGDIITMYTPGGGGYLQATP